MIDPLMARFESSVTEDYINFHALEVSTMTQNRNNHWIGLAVAITGMVLVSGGACFLFFGRSLVGHHGLSTAEMMLQPIFLVAFFSLLFGYLGSPHWILVASCGSIPVLMLCVLMFIGTVLEGHMDKFYWFIVPFGMILSMFGLCWLTSRFRKYLQGVYQRMHDPPVK